MEGRCFVHEDRREHDHVFGLHCVKEARVVSPRCNLDLGGPATYIVLPGRCLKLLGGILTRVGI